MPAKRRIENFSAGSAFGAQPGARRLATGPISGERAHRCMIKSSIVVKARRNWGGVVGLGCLGSWIALSLGCSSAAVSGTSVQKVSDGTSGTDAAPPPEDAGMNSSAPDADDSDHPAYMGAPGAMDMPQESGSIASPDGSCPLPASLSVSGLQCPSCAQTHCASAIADCDPTMVSACTEYYCKTQCISQNVAGTDACSMLSSCCPKLFATLLSVQCQEAQTGGVASTCQGVITQAQQIGYCK